MRYSVLLKMSRSLAIVAFACAALVFPTALFAAPEGSITNPACWHRSATKECDRLRGYFDSTELTAGKSPGGDPEGVRCYAGGEPIKLGVRVGGQQFVPDLGAYIRIVYRWAVPFAAILAVVVIMVAGLMWIVSGAADQKATAQQWIRNALIGLLLALGSYVILQTINPDLVALRLPRAYIVRQIPAGALWCSSDPPETRFSMDLPTSPSGYTKTASEILCDTKAYAAGRGKQQCAGDVCPSGKVCVLQEGGRQYMCVSAQLAGTITGKGVDNDVDLHAVCNNGEEFE